MTINEKCKRERLGGKNEWNNNWREWKSTLFAWEEYRKKGIVVEERKSYRQVKLGREEGKKFYGASGQKKSWVTGREWYGRAKGSRKNINWRGKGAVLGGIRRRRRREGMRG